MKKRVFTLTFILGILASLWACSPSADECDHSIVKHEAKASTCTEGGWDAYISCSKCKFTTYIEKPAIGHSYTSTVIQPSCTEKGYTSHKCICGDSYTDFYVDSTGHKYSNNICLNCGSTQKISTGLEFQPYEDGTCYVKGLGTCKDSYIVVPKTSPAGEKVVAIGSSAFYGCSEIVGVEFPETIESIGSSAFYGCTSLKKITIPKKVQTIGNSTFYGCINLEKIEIPSSVSSIGKSAFKHCDKLSLNEWDNAYYIGNSENKYLVLMKAKDSSIETCKIHDETVAIYDSAFAICYFLSEIEIPAKVTSLGDSAFYDCKSLKKVHFNAIAINNLPKNNMTFAYAGIYYGMELIVGKNVTKIPAYLFYPFSLTTSYTPRIVGVSFEENSVCQVIGGAAFKCCTSLTRVSLPSSIKTITATAFSDCDNLATVYFEDASGWFYTASDQTSGTSMSLEDPFINATYFVRDYKYGYWYKITQAETP